MNLWGTVYIQMTIMETTLERDWVPSKKAVKTGKQRMMGHKLFFIFNNNLQNSIQSFAFVSLAKLQDKKHHT